jgi:hypothetical protein
MPDDGFATFLGDARRLDPTIDADASRQVWTTLQDVQTLWQLRNADLSDEEWRIMLLATREFFKRLWPAATLIGTA